MIRLFSWLTLMQSGGRQTVKKPRNQETFSIKPKLESIEVKTIFEKNWFQKFSHPIISTRSSMKNILTSQKMFWNLISIFEYQIHTELWTWNKRDHRWSWKMIFFIVNYAAETPLKSWGNFVFFKGIYSTQRFQQTHHKRFCNVSFELWKVTWSENPAHELKVHKSCDRDVIRKCFWHLSTCEFIRILLAKSP